MNIKLKKLFGKNKEFTSILKNLGTISGLPVHIHDAHENLLFEDLNRHLTHRYPLTLNGEILGWISGNEKTEGIIPFLDFMIAAEVRKKSMADEVLNAYREITLLYNVSEKLTASLKIQHVIQVALSEATRLIKGSSGVVMLTDPNSEQAQPLAHFGSQHSFDNNYSLANTILAIVDQTSKAEIVNDLHADARFAIESSHLHSLVWAPIKTKNTILGILMIGHDDPDSEYSARDLGLLNTIASQTAPSVEKAVHYENLEKLVEARTRELSEAKDTAEMANQTKSQFLANMSHELRTPLNALLGYAQILKQEKNISEKQKDGLDIIHRSGEYLLTLINDILDLSKIEAGKMELDLGDFNLEEMLRNLTQLFKVRTADKKIAFEYNQLSTLPTFIHGDEIKLRQILINLLSNAIKFTEQGGVALKVGVVNEKVRFEIEDTGIGIVAEHLNEIFESFRQLIRRDQLMEGTGLGLAISYKLVEKMGGELKVKSEPDKGSIFWFELHFPVVDISAIESRLDQPAIIGYEGKRLKVLVVEDKWENRSVLTNILVPLGFEVIEATDGLEGVNKAAELKPDLILMDLVMPIMDGFESMRQIRRMSTGKQVCIIALSASVFESDRKTTIDAGGDDFLPKPVRIDRLLETLAKHLKISWVYKANEVSDLNQSLTSTTITPPSAHQLQPLYDFAKQGNIRGIRKEIEGIKQLDKRFIPFAKQLEKRAKNFDMKQICHFLQPYLKPSA